MKYHFCFRAIASSLVAIAAAFSLGATAQAAGPDFAGKTITVVNPSGPGGSYHLYAQIVAHHLGQYLPGNPSVIVQDRPGAGGALAAAYMMNAAPKDGTYLAEIAPGTITQPLIRNLKYDAAKFNWLGSVAARSQVVVVWHTVPVNSVDDLKKTEVTMAASGPGSAAYVVPSFINAVLGTKMKIITGYKGGGAMNLAMERGEVQGRSNYYSGFTSVHPEWIKDHKLKFLITMGNAIPQLPNVPSVHKFLKPGSVDAKVDKLMEMNFVVGQAFYLPPGVPAATVVAIRKSFAAMLADPATKKDCESRRLDYEAQSGEKVHAEIVDAFKEATPAVIKRFGEIMGVRRTKS